MAGRHAARSWTYASQSCATSRDVRGRPQPPPARGIGDSSPRLVGGANRPSVRADVPEVEQPVEVKLGITPARAPGLLLATLLLVLPRECREVGGDAPTIAWGRAPHRQRARRHRLLRPASAVMSFLRMWDPPWKFEWDTSTDVCQPVIRSVAGADLDARRRETFSIGARTARRRRRHSRPKSSVVPARIGQRRTR